MSPVASAAPRPAATPVAPTTDSVGAAPAVPSGTPSPVGSAYAPPVAPSSEGVAPAPAPAAVAPEEPPLVGPDGVALPQTEERPSVTSAAFQRRMQLLASSILSGDVEAARAAFFPLIAYTQVKDVQKPERDYRFRLMAHFERDVRDYHRKLGKDAERAKFLGVTVPEARAVWMKPGKEGNRLGYFRVLRSELRFELPSGKQRTLELTSMISWRGEWYVVHLNGFE